MLFVGVFRVLLALSCVLALSAAAIAQISESGKATVADRLTARIDENTRITLSGTVHPLVRAAKTGLTPLLRTNRVVVAEDRGAAPDGMKLDRMQIVLKRSDAQERTLRQTIQNMHTPGSASYHKWLTPDDFGRKFGPSDADVAKLEAWLLRKGFSLTRVNPGRQTIEIAGTAGSFRDTFHAEIHAYQVNGETRYANASDPDIPAALAPVFGGFAMLNNFRLRNYSRVLGKATYNAATHQARPEWTTDTYGQTNLLLAPGDFYKQYDLNRLYAAGTDGTGQSIAIVNNANINVETVNRFRALFGLPVNPPQVIIDGNDPGIDGINDPFGGYPGATTEEYLDVEWSGAVAPGATITLVTAADTAVAQGLFLAAQRAVYSNIAPVISISVGECELGLGATNQFLNGLWEQAAAQGITVTVSTGDTGSAGCEDPGGDYAVLGQQVSGFASTPYNVAVGGTDFYYANGSSDLGTYWNLNPTDSSPTISLTGPTPIPEQAWNDSQYGSNILDFYANSQDTMTTMGSGGGGSSNCAMGTIDPNNSQYDSCSAGYPKPSWQTGFGPDQVRDLPDVSLFAADGLNRSYYPLCAGDGDCIPGSTIQITGVGGTSASAPAFAGMMALVNQSYGRQGQANYVLYPLSVQYPSAFNDVTHGSNSVPCNYLGATYNGQPIPVTDCNYDANGYTVTDPIYGTATEGQVGDGSSTPYYNAVAGYDLATGLGSVDAYNMVTHWKDVALASTTTTLTPSQTSFTHGTAVNLAGSVTGSSSAIIPTGFVAFTADSAEPGQQGQNTFLLDSTGRFSYTITTLPGGTYNIWANYPGDAANAPSASAKTQITVTAEPSVTTLTIDNSNSISNLPAVVPSGGSVPYGSPLILQAVPAAQSPGTSGNTVPTGTVGFTDNLIAINTAVLNTAGEAEYDYTFPVGTHSVTASYSGDGSFQKSDTTATPFPFTVTRDTPAINLSITNTAYIVNRNEVLGSQPTTLTVVVSNSVALALGAVAPTGTVTMSGAPAGSTTTATLVASSGASIAGANSTERAASGIATFTIPAGTYGTENLTFSYQGTNGNGDTNYTTANANYSIPFIASDGTVASTTTASASAISTSPTAPVLVTVQVAGSGGVAPTGQLFVVSSGDILVANGFLPSASGNSVTVSFTVDSASLLQGTNQLTVQYLGDSRYKSSSATLTISNPLSDFSLVPTTTILKVPSTGTDAGTLTDGINLSSYNGFAGPVSLSCSPAGGVTCSLSSTSVNLSSGSSSALTLTVNTTGVAKAGTYNLLVTGTDATGDTVHTIGLQVIAAPPPTAPSFTLTGAPLGNPVPGDTVSSTIAAKPTNGFTGTISLMCAITSSPAGATPPRTCVLAPPGVSITGTAAATSTLMVETGTATTPGAYTVTVTGTSGNITQMVNLTVTVLPPPTYTLSGTAVGITLPATSGLSTIAASPSNGFTGSIALTCAVTAIPAGATGIPSCSLAPANVNMTGTASATSTMTVTTSTTTTPGDYTVTVTGASGSLSQTALITVTVSPAVVPPSFTLAGTGVSIAAPGDLGTSTITATPSNGFTGSIALACAVTASPAGATGTPGCSLAPATVSVAGTAAVSSTMTVSTGATTTAGTYTLTITGKSGSITQTAQVTVTIAPAVVPPSFALAGTGVSIAAPGDSGTSTITATPSNGFTGSIPLTCAVTSSPSGATGTPGCSLAPGSVSVTGTTAVNSTMTVTTSTTTTAGTYTVMVTGKSGSISQTAQVTLTIAPAVVPPSFALAGTGVSIAAPGDSGTSTITATPSNGFTGSIGLACAVTASPAGATGTPGCLLAPGSVSVTRTSAVSSTMTVSTGATTNAGAYTVTVTGKSGNITQTALVTVTVSPAVVPPSFALAGTGVSIAAPGDSGTSTITATPRDGFTGSIPLTCAVTSSPSGATGTPACSLAPASVSVTGTSAVSSTMTVSTGATTTAGTYTVTVTGKSGNIVETASVTVVLSPTSVTAGSFTLAAPAITVAAPGDSGSSTVTATPANGFTGPIALTCAFTATPQGANAVPACSVVPTSLNITGAAASSTLMVETSSATTAGIYKLTVTGATGSLSATANVMVTVTAAALPGSFSLIASPTAVTIGSQGASGSASISINPANGFLGAVALTCAVTSSPAGAAYLPGCSLAPGSVTVAVGKSAPNAVLTITTTAQTGAQTRQAAPPSLSTGVGVALAVLCLGIPSGRRGRRTAKAVRLLSLALACAVLGGAVTGCGSGLLKQSSSSGGTTPGSYTVTVTGSSGTETQTAAVTVTVD
jgi:uncharacterized membrane protein